MALTRRELLQWSLATGAHLAAGAMPHGAFAQESRKPVPFGAALYLPDLDADPRLGREIAAHCQRVTPVSELKWTTSRPARGVFDFSSADRVADFARDNGLAMHGHTLLWYAENPDWVNALSSAEADRVMLDHIETVMLRYRDVAQSWDVVNEPIPDVAHSPAARRDSIWRELVGDDYIARAFQRAHDLAPDALLVLNDYDLEFAIEHSPAKRAAFSHLVHELVDRGTPVHAIGLQAHLRGGWPIATDELARFVEDMRALGLEILVTELDVMDHELPGPPAERDALIAAQVEDFLGAVTASGPLHSITTWGLTDKFTWIRWAYPRADGAGNRPLPLDEDYAPKPMFDVIERYRRIA